LQIADCGLNGTDPNPQSEIRNPQSPMFSPADSQYLLRALALARRGEGHVEPNPMVGCVIVKDGQVVGEGWHQKFGGPHAEIEALSVAGGQAAGGTMYVTLEPCCHHGKTPPCTRAILAAGIHRLVAAMRDPFPQVDGGGFKELSDAGVAAEVGLHEIEARDLNAPYLKLLATGRPWVIAKWAMTLDGKIATAAGSSRWISGDSARKIVHQLRSRVDAILIGRRTAELDDPLLTARLESGQSPRIAARIVLDSRARLPSDSQLVATAREYPTVIATGPDATHAEIRRLESAGCEVVRLAATSPGDRLIQLLDELGRRRMTNILVEGGSQLLGTLFDARQIDEVHAFICPKLFGGQNAPSPIAGAGVQQVADALALKNVQKTMLEDDLYITGRTQF
jgi:diaminohydroxyphosphoribosylaminopyrimidine deaminase/5-amino-6-(5-phosphoribosylamino)uracil reductase